jgi:hypothetical protein
VRTTPTLDDDVKAKLDQAVAGAGKIVQGNGE